MSPRVRAGRIALAHAPVLALVGASLGVIAIWTVRELRQQHDQLVDVWSEQRASQLEDAAGKVAADFDDVADDLAFATRLVEQAPDPESVDRSLGALLGSIRPYRLAATFSRACARERLIVDPRWTGSDAPELLDALDASGRSACRQGDRSLEVSLPAGEGDLRWYRAYARAYPGGAVAVVVDTRPALERLRTVSADSAADLLVLGPHGTPAPITATRLSDALAVGPGPALAGLVDHMLANGQGRVMIPSGEAAALGYGNADLLVVYTAIRPEGTPPWSTAIVASTEVLREHEASLVSRVLASAGAAASVLVLLGAYLVRETLRAASNAERLRAAEELGRVRARAARILDHVPAGIVGLAAGLRVASRNEAARTWGTQAATSMSDLFPDAPRRALEQLEELARAASDTRSVQELLSDDLALFGPDGTWSVQAVPVFPPADDIECVLIVADLSEVRRLQDQLLRAEKLSTVGILAAGIAHEVGTPLGIIRGRAELLARRLGSDPGATKGLAVVIDQIDGIARTISALLDFARPSRVEVRDVAVNRTLDKVRDLLDYEATKRGIELHVSAAEGLPRVSANADKLEQVLVNLVMNALDATPPGGRVEVLADRTDRGHVALVVRDNGVGIPAEDTHRVFDPFFTTKKRGHGTGLGLAIVNQIAQEHGGSVRLESTEGRGTVVEVVLPAAGG